MERQTVIDQFHALVEFITKKTFGNKVFFENSKLALLAFSYCLKLTIKEKYCSGVL